MGKKLLLIFMILFLVDTALAATIHGTVYNLELERQENTIITVESQTYVAKDGTYSFELNVGKYEIEAKYFENNELISKATETISVKDQEDYVVDLILFPSFEEEDELLSETDLEVSDPLEGRPYFTYMLLSLFTIFMTGLGIFLYRRYKKMLDKLKKDIKETIESKEVIAESKKVLDFIKQEGRTTQKDIRMKFPSSEAKISLIISELEHKGLIEKIKKGRGNIIVLK